jgi:hypothetical protein
MRSFITLVFRFLVFWDVTQCRGYVKYPEVSKERSTFIFKGL